MLRPVLIKTQLKGNLIWAKMMHSCLQDEMLICSHFQKFNTLMCPEIAVALFRNTITENLKKVEISMIAW